jgi:hypothetical protein
VFDDLAAFARLAAGSRVLEIGPGTRQVTLPLAERGYRVVAVELGQELAAVARRSLVRFSTVDVVVAAFDPQVRIAKTAAALRSGGRLATVATHHIAGGSEAFCAEVQTCYEQWDPATPPGLRQQAADSIPMHATDLDGAAEFEPPVFHRYEWDQAYTTSAIVTCCSPTPAIAPSSRPAAPACWSASPGSSKPATPARSPSAT